MNLISSYSHAFLFHCRVSKGLSDHSLRAYRQDLDEFENYVAGKPFEEIVEREAVFGYLEFLRERRKLQARTIKRRIACLKAFFKGLEREEVIETSPFHKMDISIPLPKQLPKSLSPTELRSLVLKAWQLNLRPHPLNDANINFSDIYFTSHLVILLMAATGIRVGELVSISLGDIDEVSGAIRIFGKGSRERTVFVTNEILRLLLKRFLVVRRNMKAKSNAVFLNRSNAALTTQALRLRIKKIAVEAKIQRNVTPHMLRHTAATSLIEAGVDIRYVQRLLGHQSISTTELYTHVSDQSLKNALTKADTIGRLMP